MEIELADSPVDLCDGRGRLNPAAKGWTRHPVHACAIPGHWGRRKRWNYWCFTSETHLFSVTASSLDYAGLFFVYMLDFATKEFFEDTITVPLARGVHLPDTVDGRIEFAGHNSTLVMDARRGATDIDVTWNGPSVKNLSARFSVRAEPAHETLNVVVPWSDSRFQFTSKQECLKASGEVRLGDRLIQFHAADTFGCLDFGRGVWPYRCFWNWGAASGRYGGRTVGLNFGAGWTDGTGHTENGVVVDGRLHKIHEDVRFVYDTKNYTAPWRVESVGTDRVGLTFTPFFERIAKSNLGLIRSEVHQMIGRYEGRVLLDDGTPLDVSNLVGWAEDHHARW